MRQALSLAVASDIHLGHRRNPTARIVANLDACLTNSQALLGVDFLFLAGDVFDESIDIHADPVGPIVRWISHVLSLCIKLDIELRVLEGTPSHDREQSHLFELMNEVLLKQTGRCAKLRYVRALEIEYVPAWDLHILYVPDEINHSCEKTLEEVQALLAEKGLTQVDLAIMHGQFKYQLPAAAKNVPSHDEQAYLALVKHLIFIGHVHTTSHYQHIHAQGSTDRLAHGEEGPKGYLKARIEVDGTTQVQFVENVGALKFITLECTDEDVAACLDYIVQSTATLENGAHVRVRVAKTHPLATNPDLLKGMCVGLHLTLDVKSAESDMQIKSFVEVVQDDHYQPLILSPQSLGHLVLERLRGTGLDARTLERSHQHLQRAIAACS